MLNICGLKLWGLGESEVEESANSYQCTVEPVRKGKYRPLPNLVNIFYDITGCRFNMFTIFEME